MVYPQRKTNTELPTANCPSPTRPHLTTGGEPAEGMGPLPSSAAEKVAFRCRRLWGLDPWAVRIVGLCRTRVPSDLTRKAKRSGSPGPARGKGILNVEFPMLNVEVGQFRSFPTSDFRIQHSVFNILFVLGGLSDGTAMTGWALQRPSNGRFVPGVTWHASRDRSSSGRVRRVGVGGME